MCSPGVPTLQLPASQSQWAVDQAGLSLPSSVLPPQTSPRDRGAGKRPSADPGDHKSTKRGEVVELSQMRDLRLLPWPQRMGRRGTRGDMELLALRGAMKAPPVCTPPF